MFAGSAASGTHRRKGSYRYKLTFGDAGANDGFVPDAAIQFHISQHHVRQNGTLHFRELDAFLDMLLEAINGIAGAAQEVALPICFTTRFGFYSGQIALPQPPSKPITDQRKLRPQPRCRALLAFAFGDRS
ncbi:MAG: hypothetical protein C0510_04095 [Erythrobacter sp.]|nr:hypothetical protein [Erythrobacter sp.]